MKSESRRWVQRLHNYNKALSTLEEAAALAAIRPLSNLEKQGVIKAFEFTHELAWNVLKDYLEYQGITGVIGSRDAIRESFQRGLITSGEVWMGTIQSRNLSSHTYNEKTAEELYQKILADYVTIFRQMLQKMTELSHAK